MARISRNCYFESVSFTADPIFSIVYGLRTYAPAPSSKAALTRSVNVVECKVNFLAPAKGREFIARGRVVRPGHRITVCTGEVLASSGSGEKSICLMQATMASLTDCSGLRD